MSFKRTKSRICVDQSNAGSRWAHFQKSTDISTPTILFPRSFDARSYNIAYSLLKPHQLQRSLDEAMAETLTNGLKRPHPEDDLSSSKRSRSNNGSPAPQPNGSGQKPDVSKIMAEARAKAAAAAAKLQTAKPQSPAPASPSLAPLPAGGATDIQSRIAQMKARVEAATAKSSAAASGQQRVSSPLPGYQPPMYEDTFAKSRGGLDVGLHPALMGDSGTSDNRSSKTQRSSVVSKFPTTIANRRAPSPQTPSGKKLDLTGPSLEEARQNPYFDASLGAQTALPRGHKSRQLLFNQKGKYIAQATALRRQAALEAMKKRIAESSRKAGIDEELSTEKAFLVQPPPEIEWWDEGLLSGSDYTSDLKISTLDSIITLYIQHPVPLDPPQEKNLPPPKPMYLTSRETAKIRRQRRAADLKEQQAKIRLGLEPAPPPKVKKNNLMRVLGNEAVKDPTAVEARVNREIADRLHKHEEMNQERKLTKEERNEKLVTNQQKDAQHGIHATVYKIDNLANGRHRFKISKNAEQQALTGICIQSPKFSLVIVEGGSHSISAYKKLMLHRIDWTENSPSLPEAVREGNKAAAAAAANDLLKLPKNNNKKKETTTTTPSFLQPEDEAGNLKDLRENKCVLVWEGELKQRGFRKWGARVCETEKEAVDVLARGKMESMWTLAKSLK